MAYRCDICGRGKTKGVSRAHKYGGKWAMRAMKKPKVWKPNLQNFVLAGKKMRLCTRCIKRIKFDLREKHEKVKKAVEVKPEVKKVEEKVEKPVEKKASKRTSKTKTSKK